MMKATTGMRNKYFALMMAFSLMFTLFAGIRTPSAHAAETNVALQAAATASSVYPGYAVSAVNDGVVDGYPGDSSKEWASYGEKAGAWAQLSWSSAQTINKVSLFDRPNGIDQVTSGILTFSDGSSVSVGALPDDASSPATVSFADKTVTWVKFTVNSVSSITANVGLAEFQVFSGSGGSTPPVAPTGLKAMAGNTQASLSWTASSGATSYNIGRSTVSGGPYTTIVTGVTSTSYVNTGLTNGTTYYYVASATNSGGTSGNSNEASATPAVVSVTNVALQATATASSVTAGFPASAINDGVVAGYPDSPGNEWASAHELVGAWVQLSWGSAQTINQISLFDRPNTSDQITSGTLSFSDGSSISVGALPNDASSPATVTFADKTVSWVKFTADSVLSGTFAAGLAEFQVFSGSGSTLPAAPTGLAAAAGDTQVNLSWNPSSGATSYNIGRSTVSGGPYTTIATGVTSAAYMDLGLTNGTTYYYVATATNGNGTSGYSNEASVAPQGAAGKIRVDANSNPYVNNDGGTSGPWANKKGGQFPFLSFSGAWWSDGWNWMYDNATTGDYVDFYFTGSYIGLYMSKLPWGCIVDIYVDGTKEATVDTYDGATKDTDNSIKVFEKNGLSTGKHKLRVKVAGKSQTANAFSMIKAFECYGTAAGMDGSEWTEPGIKVTSMPNKKDYSFGESLDLSGLEVSYYDGVNNPAPIAVTTDMLSGFDSEIAGTKTVTITYKGYTTTFSVKVIDKLISVITPKYYSDITNRTITVEFNAPGFTKAKAESLHAPDDVNTNPYGYMKSVAENIALSADKYGAGSFSFNAADFPNGPISIHITAWNDNHESDDCYLQLVNYAGVDWNGGAANTIDKTPSAITEHGLDMKQVFKDNFSQMPTISYTGAGEDVKYAAAKPDPIGWPEYGDAKFAPPNYSYGDVAKNYSPFAITNNQYMKIETKDWGKAVEPNWGQKFTTGFLSSMGTDGSGFFTKPGAAQYFEIRMFIPPNAGLWPSFWTLSPNDPNSPGVDEQDILEAYMGGTQTTITEGHHTWNYGNTHAGSHASTNDFGNGINLAEGWHTYGMLITEDKTSYYFDDQYIEGSAHTTQLYAWTKGNYFMINPAYRQSDADSYPGGFQRYGNTAENYVDWVRVYQVQNVGFTPMNSKIDVTPGKTVTISILRDDNAKSLSGTYDVVMPDGWSVESGRTFSANSGKDTIVLNVPGNYGEFQGVISITPVVGDTRYDAKEVKFKTLGLYTTEVYPSLNGTGDGYVIHFKFGNHSSNTLNNILVTAKGPDGWSKTETIPTVGPEGSGIATFQIPSPDLYNTTNYTFDVKLSEDYTVTVQRPISGLVALKAETPVTIDGSIHPNEWAGAVPLVLNQKWQSAGTWNGMDDLSAVGKLKWDDNYLYVAVDATDNVDSMEQDNFANAWQGDSLQISFDPARVSGPVPGGPHLSFTAALNSNTGVYGCVVDRSDYPELGLHPGQLLTQSKCVVKRDEANKKTTYTIAFAWNEIRPNAYIDVSNMGIALLINDNDGAGRKGWLSYMGGIATGKDPAKFGDLILTDLTRLDNTPPTTTASLSPEPNAAGWNNTEVSVDLQAVDNNGGTGVSELDYSATGAQLIDATTVGGSSASVKIDTEGTTALSYQAKDAAGNVEAVKQQTVRIDKTSPTLSITGGGTYTVDQDVKITCSAADALSGLVHDPCTTRLVDAPAYTLDLGEHNAGVQATDNAGNTATASAGYTIAVTSDSLQNLTVQFVVGPGAKGIGNSLVKKLQHNQFDAYIHEVSAQSGKALTTEQAQTLIRLAKSLKN